MLTLDPKKCKISTVWRCPECGEARTADILLTFEIGGLLCTKHHPDLPDIEMGLISFVLEDKN